MKSEKNEKLLKDNGKKQKYEKQKKTKALINGNIEENKERKK